MSLRPIICTLRGRDRRRHVLVDERGIVVNCAIGLEDARSLMGKAATLVGATAAQERTTGG